MVREGLLQEVAQFEADRAHVNRTVTQAIGYKQCLAFLETAQTEADYAHFLQEFKTASRHLVKRQYTWFRKEPSFNWLDVGKVTQETLLKTIIDDYYREPHDDE
jgi:tRNA dimethylallyltransferase